MSSQDHTYLCKALLARLNQAVAQIQISETSTVRLLTKLWHTTHVLHQLIKLICTKRVYDILIISLCVDQLLAASQLF